jgi:hypothetical protein
MSELTLLYNFKTIPNIVSQSLFSINLRKCPFFDRYIIDASLCNMCHDRQDGSHSYSKVSTSFSKVNIPITIMHASLPHLTTRSRLQRAVKYAGGAAAGGKVALAGGNNYILHCRKVGLYCPEIGFVARVHILQPEGPRVEGGEDPRAVIIARVLLSQLRAIKALYKCSL